MKQLPAWFQEKDNCYLVHSAWLAELIICIHVYTIVLRIVFYVSNINWSQELHRDFRQNIFHLSTFQFWELLASAIFNTENAFLFTFYAEYALTSVV